jgi:hypothetical protein
MTERESQSMSGVEFEECAPAVTEARVRAFERKHGVSLPELYKRFLLRINGGHPIPDGLQILLQGRAVDWRLHYFLGLDDPTESCNLDWVMELTDETRPAGFIPIVSDEGGNFFYLELGQPHDGGVYFGATPADGRRVDPVLVSVGFDAFLRSLS